MNKYIVRAKMKLATGVIPVALGVTIAFIPGVINASQTVISDKTLASVGYRPVIAGANIYAEHNMQKDITDASTIIPVGGVLYVNVGGVSDTDSDDLSPNFMCKVIALNADNTEILVTDEVPCKKGTGGSIPITIVPGLAGKRIAVDIFANSDVPAAQLKRYTPTPEKSLPYRIISSNPVEDR